MHRVSSFLQQHSVTIILFGILIFGGYIRLHNLGEPSLWIDEGYSINAAQQILKHDVPLLESGQMYTNQPLASYIVAGSIKIFGFDPYSPWSARLPFALFGIFNILMVFLLTKRLFDDQWIALGAAFFTAFFPWEIAWARQARGYSMLQFFLLLSFDHVIGFIQERKTYHALLASISFLFAYFSHNLAIAFLPGLFLVLGLWMLLGIQKISWRKSWPFLLLSIAAIAVGQSWLQNLDIINYIEFYNRFIIENMPWIFGFGFIGFILAIFQKRYIVSGILLLGTTTIAYVIIASYGVTLQYRYLVPLIPFLGIGCIYFLYDIFHKIISATKRYSLHTIVSPIVCIIFCILLVITNQSVFHPTSQLDTGSPQPDFKHAYEYIKENKNPYDVVVSPYAHLTNIYLGYPETLLPISLTGRTQEFNLTITKENTDYYTNAPIVQQDEFLNFIHNNNGYIILDSMAISRIPEIMQTIQSQKLQLVFLKYQNTLGIWVFKF
ncbi:MAG: glycosyltransferase family 39 protein [Candidatus Pacebacteria bacterium]|nr:glycosyltransferase family 39 protein [Candidatus Paceibacterota bacterium]